MFHAKALGLTALTSVLLASAPAHAVDYLTGYVGWFDVTQQDDEATQLGLEYRMTPWEYGIRPTLGANITTDGSFYGYGGFNWDIELVNNQVYLVPNFMVGGYAQGDGKDLGSSIEFRSGIEIDYQFANASRVGVAFNHISNASIGDKNPGAETVLINYSMPVGTLMR
jgi:lipid A 3-O-deacylase